MEEEKIEQYAKNVLRRVLIKLHNKDYEGVEKVVDKLNMEMGTFLDIMECVEDMMDSESTIDELSDDEILFFEASNPFEVFHEANYRLSYRLKSYGYELGVYMDLDFIVTKTKIVSILRTIDI